MEKESSLADQPVDTALERLVLAKRQDVDDEYERFVRIADPESLHDLRVALRRLHSLFIGFAPCFKAGITQAITLKALFKETNHARDLEVTLALLEQHHLALPWLQQDWQNGLVREYQRLREYLPQGWQSLSRQFDTPRNLLAEQLPSETIGLYAAMQIAGQKKTFLKGIKGVAKKWDDRRAHKLRIRGKHCRYLIEPFTAGASQAERAVSKLKRFQDELGEYHDLVVLRQQLKQLQKNAPLTHFKALEQARQTLEQQQQRLRRRIRKDYSGRRYRKLRKALQAAQRALAPV